MIQLPSKILFLTITITSLTSSYPLFKQCDDAWGQNYLGYAGNRTVCLSGCLISSVSMALNDCNILLIDNQAANPGTINEWLKANDGYEEGYGFKWNSTESLGLVFQRFTQDAQEMKDATDSGLVVILHVHNNNHYVLMTGYDGDDLLVNDPYYDSAFYPANEAIKGQAAIFTRPEGCKTQPQETQSFMN